MKRFIYLFLSVLLAFAVSCQKAKTPQEMLIGSWEVSEQYSGTVTVSGITTSNNETLEGVLFTFDQNGNGKRVFDGKAASFTYHFKDNNTISYLMVGGSQSEWTVDELADNTFVFHETQESGGSVANYKITVTYRGKKIQ